VNSDDDDDETIYKKSIKDSVNRSTSMSDNLSISAKPKQTSFDSIIGRKSVLARAELWDRRISTNENETNEPVSTYDIEQWSTEFERIQNQN
jgi:hypothetical protein